LYVPDSDRVVRTLASLVGGANMIAFWLGGFLARLPAASRVDGFPAWMLAAVVRSARVIAA
jgi:hypothetical protein